MKRWLICVFLALRYSPAADLDSCKQALSRGEYAEAERTAAAYVRAHPRSAAARVILAQAHIGLNDAASAMADLREALRFEPANIDALYYCSKLAGVLANEQFQALWRTAPDSARVHQIKAEGLAAKGDIAGAETEYRIALEKRPGTASIMNALADLKRAAADYGPALELYDNVLAQDAGNYDALYGAGACHLRQRDAQRALPFFRRALKADPNSVAAKMALGETLLVSGQGTQAIAMLEEAARLDPKFKRLQYLLARAYRAAGREQDAERALKAYRQLDAAAPNTTGGMGDEK